MGLSEFLTVKEAARLLKTTRQQIRKMIANEELPAVKVGREWRIPMESIYMFLKIISKGSNPNYTLFNAAIKPLLFHKGHIK